jgi:hypothetical protein
MESSNRVADLLHVIKSSNRVATVMIIVIVVMAVTAMVFASVGPFSIPLVGTTNSPII